MSRLAILLCSALLIFSAGCAKQKIYSTPPLKQHKVQKQDSPDVINPVLKTDPYTINGRSYVPHLSSRGYKAQGLASWYGDDFHGKSTANGETYNMYAMTAAHRTLPMGTMLEVTDRHSGRKVIVRVNDRGPFADPDQRIIDLSYSAASKLGIINKGLTPVELQAINDTETKSVEMTEVVTEAVTAEETALSETIAVAPAVEEVASNKPVRAQENYYIQVGSFTDYDRAVSIMDNLRDRGYKQSRMVEVSVNGQKYMRVQAGQFANIPIAEDAVKSLSNDFGEIFIVTE